MLLKVAIPPESVAVVPVMGFAAFTPTSDKVTTLRLLNEGSLRFSAHRSRT